MNSTLEKTPQAPTQPQWSKEDIDNYFRSPEGQQALRQSRLPQSHKLKSAMSEAEQDKYCKMAEKQDIQYIRIDPSSGKPLTEEKGQETFWKILNVIPEAVGNSESELRINFFIQRYFRNKTYERPLPNSELTETVNEPYMVTGTSRWTKLERIIELGDRIIDAEDFTKQYKRFEE